LTIERVALAGIDGAANAASEIEALLVPAQTRRQT
jgi:hypothetical protein